MSDGCDLPSFCAYEVCERAARILVASQDLCAETGCPLSPEQQIIIGSAVLQAFVGIEDCFGRLARSHSAIDVFSDERLAAWVDGEMQ